MNLLIPLDVIKLGVIELCQRNKVCREHCHVYLRIEKWDQVQTRNLLSTLSELLLNSECTEAVAESFPSLLLQILSNSFNDSEQSFDKNLHKVRCVALGKLVTIHQDAVKFSLEYFRKNPPPFHAEKGVVSPCSSPRPKKKKVISKEVPDYDLVLATHNFLSTSCEHWRQHWNWSSFLEYLKHRDEAVRWLACQCIATVSGMAYCQRQLLTSKYVTNESALKLCLEFEEINMRIKSNKFAFLQESTSDSTAKNESLSITSPFVVSVAGILLPVFDSTQTEKGNLVLVQSTITNLRSLALAVASGKAVCLEGPVGCGKTALVEYLALITGRRKSPNFIKIQLGDQTDSKMLLGTYRCTDVPGEFVWHPGVLTQAVIAGHWILLEDIDSAPTDVIAVLASLMETGSISVPGYRDSVHAAPGFQLFTTQRLIPGNVGGFHKQQIGSSGLMEKLWIKVSMEPLSGPELIHVVKTLHPVLNTITPRLLKVYLLFSAGRHHTALPVEEIVDETPMEVDKEINVKAHTIGSRLTSTRDLLKWCARIIVGYDVSSQESSLNVLAHAMDMFCCSMNDPGQRLELAGNVAVCLGIIRPKAEYLCLTCKPVVNSCQEYFCVGRAKLKRLIEPNLPATMKTGVPKKNNFCLTRPTCQLLERVGVCITRSESVLLVGETGTGKTSVVQFLATELNSRLIVLNMNQQSDTADLLGGYKPVDLKCIVTPVKENYETLFVKTFSRKQNVQFLEHVSTCYRNKNWKTLLKLMKHTTSAGIKRVTSGSNDKDDAASRNEWMELWKQLERLEIQLKNSTLAFSFIEGSLVKALRAGWWVLLDEINLATGETLECLSGLLEGVGDINGGSLCLHERGDTTPIVRHPNFRLFACMNPATDVGKKDLPPGLRNRFTEFFVDEIIDKNDLIQLCGSYLSAFVVPPSILENIVSFYLKVRKEATISLSDGTGHKPHYSLRTLCRALTIAASNPCGAYLRSLYEAFCLGFLTQLDRVSYPLVESMISKALFKSEKENKSSLVKKPIPEPNPQGSHVYVEGYWVRKGSLEPKAPERYILTPSVRQNLRDIARIVSLSGGSQPALIQGETSVGKTSLVEYLAAATGNVTLRVNNHEHTDLQEYVGAYTADPETGKMVFNEGVLVEAMKKGYWIILDELNLAPSDVLEALNRVLDDNRELYIPETQEMVQAHPHFMLFATQNPPGHYGGRKLLSRAFRNRFVELHFDEIPPEELRTILEMRCDMPPSYSKKLVSVMTDLQIYRRGSAMFAGKQGFITLRDLFRWGERYRLAKNPQGDKTFYDWDSHLAHEGFLLLAGRVRKEEERKVIAEAMKKHLKRSVDPDELFTLNSKTSPVTRHILEELVLTAAPNGFQHLVWTKNMRRQAVLLAKAFQFDEPVLLVGETGIGKTTTCQLIAALRGQKLHTVNCHMHTEGADFLGGLRPVREHSNDSGSDTTKKLFEWVDGPLIKAMSGGDVFLADEISLADDSVLERLNSLLEPERKLLLAEKGGGSDGANAVVIVAHPKFHFVGTMNPGGDFGKKELSPALRNRFTEIWCEGCRDRGDLMCLIEENLRDGLSLANQEDATSGIGHIILEFVSWFTSTEIGKRFTISIRDYLNWINFINVTTKDCDTTSYNDEGVLAIKSKLDLPSAIVHGACFTFLDSLGSGISSSEKTSSLRDLQESAVKYLVKLVEKSSGVQLNIESFLAKNATTFEIHPNRFGTVPFFIGVGDKLMYHDIGIMQRFSFDAPTTGNNARRLLRALQIGGRPILLEGSPGVGKTALVAALSNGANHRLVRINLSEQTDVSDLFGADLPVEGGEGGQFAWRDGPFLQALKSGSWIVLDELNLASQSVLEGLNAALDHRGEVYVPELGRTFFIQKNTTRIFACQNPLNQGGARRGLPRSFLNRFTQVYIDALTSEDLELILASAFPAAPQDLISLAVSFNAHLARETQELRLWGHRGAPWEFNLRDLMRWFEAMYSHHDYSKKYGSGPTWEPAKYVQLLYVDRMRTPEDKEKVKQHYMDVFAKSLYKEPTWDPPRIRVGGDNVWFGDINLMRTYAEPLTYPLAHNAHPRPNQLLLHRDVHALRSVAICVQMKWLPILVGGVGSGKTSLIQLLAHLTGNELRIMPVNSSMDTTEILGGFEQTDYTRHFDLIAEKTERLVMHSLRKHLLSPGEMRENANNSIIEENLSMARNLLRRWEEFQRLSTNFHIYNERNGEIRLFHQKMESLLEVLKTLEQIIVSNISTKAKSMIGKVEKLWKDLKADELHHEGTLKAEIKMQFDSLAAQASELVEYALKITKKTDSNYKKLKQLWEEFEYYLSFTHEIDEASDAFPVGSLFKKRLLMLKEVLKILKLNNVIYERTEAESMIWQLENLESIIEGDGGKLNGGGKFEWIDSILVKCLKEGCWLVVENVNLCSSAVLDRLNALLEPNGTLTIGERGVGPYDDPPTIIPHPDFRLFFTLDPRHGQISRAMRNRGVEIFILSSEEGIEYDLMDTRALLSESGVENVDLQSKLLAIHNLLSARFIGPDKPSLQKLLCVTFLLYQQLSHSALTSNSLRESIKSAFCDVYIRPQKGSIEAKRAALVVLNEALQVISNSDIVDCDIADSINSTMEKYIGGVCKEVSDWHITPRCSDLEVDTFGFFSRQRGVILEMSLVRLGPGKPPNDFPGVIYKHSPENTLPDIKLPFTEIWRSGLPDGSLSAEGLDAWKFLSRAILAYYSTSSADESVFRHCHLNSLTKSVRKSVRVNVDKMSETVSNVISQFPCRPDKPWDPRWWNNCEAVDQKVNAWDFLMELRMMQVMEFARSEDNLWWIKPKKEKHFLTLKDIHRHLKDGSLPEALKQQHTAQPIAIQYMSLCQLLDTVFDSVLRKCSECVDSWEVFWHALQWRARFIALGLLPICKSNKVAIPPQMEELLWIHVKWILKHVARPLSSVVPCTSREASSSLEELLKTLVRLEKSHSKASDSVVHLAKAVGAKFGWPNPYGKEEEAIAAKEIERLEKVICHNSYSPDLKSSNVCFLLTNEGIRCHQNLISAHLNLWDGDICSATTITRNVLEQCKSVKLKLLGSQSQEVGKELMENGSCLPSTVSMADAIDAQLWPLNEIIVTTLSACLKKLLFTKIADFYSDESYLHSLSHKGMEVGKESENMEAISARNERNLIDANEMLPLLSSLYFAAMQSTSTTPRLAAAVRRLHDIIKLVHEGGPLNVSEWLVSAHEFVVSSAIQDEVSPARCDIIKWTNVHGLPQQDESDILSRYQQNERKPESIQMHSPVLSLAVISFIINDELNKNPLLRSAPINMHNKRRTQLKIVSETLWKNQNSLCSEDFDYRINDAKSASALSSALLMILKTNSSTNDASNTWEGMLCLYTKLLEEKNQMLQDTLQQWNSGNKDEVMLISLTGMCLSLYGGLCVLLRTASGLVDPAQKRSLKVYYYKDELEDLQLSSYVHDMHSMIEIGLKLDDLSKSALHPNLYCMKTRASNLQKKVKSLSERIAARPTPSAYYELSKALHNFVMRISSPKTLGELHDKLSEDIKNLMSSQHCSSEKFISNAKKSLQECNSLRKSLLQFVHQLTSQFGPWYKEMVTPVIGSIHQIMYGLSLQASALEKVLFLTMNNLLDMSLTSQPSPLDNLMIKLVCFPTIGPGQQSLCSLAKACVSSITINLVEKAYNGQDISSDEKERYIKWQSLRLMMVGLEEIKNELAIRKEIARDHKSWDALIAVLCNLAMAWKKDQELRKIRKAEEESLFSTRCAKRPGEDDDQIDPVALALQFPTFKEDFQDIEGLITLDDEPSHEELDLKNSSFESLDFITEEYMAQIANLHSKLVTSLTASSWILPNSDSVVELKESINYVEPLLERFGIFRHLLQYFCKVVSSDIDVILHPSLSILSAVALQESSSLGDCAENKKMPFLRMKNSSTSSKDHPDFYHDSWQSETVRCYPLLKGLKTDVQKLLTTWPEHPVLNQIIVVVDRIIAFSPTSPLARFVTGLELTLAKAQEWEANAHSGVSLSNHLSLLTTQILEWRKLELSCWKDCLNRSVERAKARASKWWFHLFCLVHNYVNPEEDNDLDDQKDSLKAAEPRELLNLLKQFIEDSPVVEFKTRLDLLYSFHCHTIHMEVSERQRDLQKMLWNVHSFYSQFSDRVKNYIERLRKPIEKKLKDFVKIARWNDISYWSVKETVTKVHRTLHKHVREFEKILQYPVSSVLTQPKEKETVEEGIWDKDNQVYVAYLGEQDDVGANVSLVDTSSYLSLQKQKQKIEAPKTDSGSLIGASGSYFNRARHLCKAIVTSFKYPSLNHAVEKMTVEVIETASELGSLQVPVGLPKPKQKSVGKNILQRKRRALADLFQMISKMGISYRKGLMIIENSDSKDSWTGSLEVFLLPPLNMDAAFKQLKYRKADGYLLKMWNGCEKYYVRSIARLTQLNTLLSISPSKDLGPPSIERFRGSTAHLMHMAKQQKGLLIQSSNQLVMLRQQLSYLSSLGKSDENCLIPKQDLLKHLHARLLDLLCSSIVCLSQIWLYLHACPSDPPSESECLRIVKLPEASSGDASETNFSNSVMGDEKWQSATNDVRLFVASLTQLKSDVERMKITSDFPVTPAHWVVFLRASDNLEIYVDRIKKMRTMLFGQFTHGSVLPCAVESLDWLVNEMMTLSNEIKCENERISLSKESATAVPEDQCTRTNLHSQLENHAESLLKRVLLIFQSFFKKYCGVKEKEGERKEDAEVGGKENGAEDKENVAEDKENDDDEIQDGHLSEKINASIASDVEILQLGSITSELKELIQDLCFIMDEDCQNPISLNCKRMVLSCLPALDQLSLLAQFVVTQLTVSYRTTSKLLSVLLALFSDLATRGFCIPRGLDGDEEGKEDGPGGRDGKWEESEGVGLGDAEDGDEKAKEASDKLESEDQLEGAHQEGKEKEEKADKDIKEEETGVEMSEDFEGKLQDLGEKEEEGDGESDSGDDDDDAEKQMGKTGSEAEKLDEQIWGSDESEDEEEEGEEMGSDGEDDQSKGKGEQPELKAKDQNLGKAEGEEEEGEGKEDKKKKKPDINEMEEKGEIDDDQVDPYHGNQEPLPEPEALDLPDDLQLDDGEAKDKEGDDEENPFDIDKMKELGGDGNEDQEEEAPQQEEEKGVEGEPEGDEGEGEDEEEGPNVDGLKQDKSEEMEVDEEGKEEEGEDDKGDGRSDEKELEMKEEEKGDEDEKPEEKQEGEEEALPSDDRPSIVPVESSSDAPKEGSKDKTENSQEELNMEEGKNEEDSAEKHGVGLAQEEQKKQGHGGETEDASLKREKAMKEEVEKEEKKRRRKPGELDSKRTLGEIKEPLKKKLKTVETESKKEALEEDSKKESVEEEKEEKSGEESEMYEHIKEAKQRSEAQTLDAATEDQAKLQPTPNLEEKEADKNIDEEEDLEMQEDKPVVVDEENPLVQKPEETEGNENEKRNKDKREDDQKGEGRAEGKAEVEGEVVPTENVPRGAESSFHTLPSALDHKLEVSLENPEELRKKLEQQLAEWSQPPAGDEALSTWENFVVLTESLSRDLSEQLRLVLEPTHASRLRGDYRTGRRINMRKVIPYIASQFRKDKIWLRRTKPSKREYQIVLAIDDSSSMADNHSKELAFESLALVSRALTLLEAGQLAVVSFGESVKVLHPLHEPFSEHSGARLLQQFSFDQKKTLMGSLMETVTSMLCGSKSSCSPGVGVAQLMVIVSDGRGVWNEGSEKVKNAVRRAQDSGIFTVFVIIDNPESKDSIMDIRMPIFKDGKMLGISSYLDNFPFPFYLILRNINALPGVLSDALRQWFELVTEMDKQ